MKYLEFLILYFSIINLYGFYLCYCDKRRAIGKKWRIKESVLLFISFMGGCYGFYVGMRLFCHKTRKLNFEILIPLFMLMWGYFLVRVVR